MRMSLSGIVLFALLAAPVAPQASTQDKSFDSGLGALAQDKKDRGKTPELTKKYTALMKANSAEMKGIHDDIEKDKPEAEIKKRLTRIKENAAKARELKYRKDEDEAEKLESLFDVFELKIKQDFEAVEWGDKERRLFLHERLQAKCDVCHELLRD